MRYETTARTLCERRREREETEYGCGEISLMKRHQTTHTTQSCKSSGVNNNVLSFLPYDDDELMLNVLRCHETY